MSAKRLRICSMPPAGTWKAGQLLKNRQRRSPPNRTLVARSIFQTAIRSQSAPEHSMLLFTVRVREAAESRAYRQIYLNGARNLLDRFAETNLLFTSSTSVYAQRDGSWVTEESETNPARETGWLLLGSGKAGARAARDGRAACRYLRPGQVGVTEQVSCRHSNHRSGKRSLR